MQSDAGRIPDLVMTADIIGAGQRPQSPESSVVLNTSEEQAREASREAAVLNITAEIADATSRPNERLTATMQCTEGAVSAKAGIIEHSLEGAKQQASSAYAQQQQYRNADAACIQSDASQAVYSARPQNHNLLMMGSGKYKLKSAHYTFDPNELERIAAESRLFTRDGFAHGLAYKNPACSRDACWLPEKPFECCDHRGHHCWLDPPVSMIEATLQSYAAAKKHDPSNTSMCILVPVMRKTSWWKKLKSMKRIRMYPKGAEVLLSGLDHKARIQLPYRAAVFYDPSSRPAALGSVGKLIDTQHHMVFNTQIAGKEARVLLDTGASQCFISKGFCESVKMQSVAAPLHSKSGQQEEQKS